MDEAKRLFSQATDARKVRATVLFPSVMVHSKVVFLRVSVCVVAFLFVFILPYLQDQGLLRFRHFATRQRDVTKNYPLFRAQKKE